MASLDDLDAARVNAALRGTIFAGNVHHFSTIESTNAHALAEAQRGAAAGSTYIADEQTLGRGRGGHSWESVRGDGLYVSVLLRPHLSPQAALLIALAAALAARMAVESVAGAAPDIRWPNDLMLDGKKCGGILVETAVDTAAQPEPMLRHVVIGIGINVNQRAFAGELGALATSLRITTGEVQRREELLLALLPALAKEVASLENNGAINTLARFAEASTWAAGKAVHVDEMGGYTGVTDGLDPRGFLRVRAADGSLRTVLNGGVRQLK